VVATTTFADVVVVRLRVVSSGLGSFSANSSAETFPPRLAYSVCTGFDHIQGMSIDRINME
jgi:hypothetical protein